MRSDEIDWIGTSMSSEAQDDGNSLGFSTTQISDFWLSVLFDNVNTFLVHDLLDSHRFDNVANKYRINKRGRNCFHKQLSVIVKWNWQSKFYLTVHLAFKSTSWGL